MTESDESTPVGLPVADGKRNGEYDFRSLADRVADRWREWRSSSRPRSERWHDTLAEPSSTDSLAEAEEPFVYPVARRTEPVAAAVSVGAPADLDVASTGRVPVLQATGSTPTVIFPAQSREPSEGTSVWSERTRWRGRALTIGGALAAVLVLVVVARSALLQNAQRSASADSALSFAQPTAAAVTDVPPTAAPALGTSTSPVGAPPVGGRIAAPNVAPGSGVTTNPPSAVTSRSAPIRRGRVRATGAGAARVADRGSDGRGVAPAGVTVRLVAETMIASYASAIEARDVDRLKRVYPALTSAERASWERFFRDLATVDARLQLRDFRILPGGDAAEARVTGSYAYETRAGRDGWERVNLDARFRRTPEGAWRLARIR